MEKKFKQTEIGMIPEDWGIGRIGDLFNVKNGKTNSQDAVENGKYPLFDRSTKVKKSNKFLFDSEAIIIPGEGKEFIPRYFSGKFDLHQRAYAITPREKKANLKFFFYVFLKNKDYLSRIAVGSTVRSLRLNHLTDFPIPIPPLPERRAIAKILSDLDSKIELLQKQNATLEKIGQAIFKHWFVDFEFPNEEGKPYKSSGGEMVYNEELGKEIPKGWNVGKLGEIANISIGRTPPRKESKWFSTNKKDWKWISIKDLGNSGVYILDTSECLTDEAVNKFNIP
ncbi:MAG: restriction endonuclease subunit S, partial [Candidatus Heimdallarchaeaceae archaeon]